MKNVRFAIPGVFALALMLVLVGAVAAEETKGKFKNALDDNKTFILTDQAKQEHTYQLGATAKVFIDNREGALTDLKAGDMITVTWQEKNGRKEASRVVCNRK